LRESLLDRMRGKYKRKKQAQKTLSRSDLPTVSARTNQESLAKQESKSGSNDDKEPSMNAFARVTSSLKSNFKLVLESIAVIVGIAVLFVYGGQLSVMQQTLRAEQRAWLSAKGPESSPTITDGQPIKTLVHVVNTGRTPAKNVSIETVVDIIRNNEDPISSRALSHHHATTGVIWPNDPIDIPAELLEGNGFTKKLVTPEMHAALTAGQAYIVIYGKVEYTDIFNVSHRTRFCGWYAYASGYYGADKCTESNGIDDEK
jgi:hypothetical protein